jgi:hypothetical protein
MINERLAKVIDNFVGLRSNDRFSLGNLFLENVLIEFDKDGGEDWGVYANDPPNVEIYNPESDLVFTIKFNDKNEIVSIEPVDEETIRKTFVNSVDCPLCDHKMYYTEIKNDKGTTTNADGELITAKWTCEECPGVLFEYYNDEDVKVLLSGENEEKGNENE